MSYLIKFGGYIALVVSLLGLYFKNSILSISNQKLKTKLLETKKISDIQEKVINASENIESTNLDGITNLMRKDKL